MSDIDFEGFDEVQNCLKQLPEMARVKTLLAAQRKAAKPLVKTAKQLAPKANRSQTEWFGSRRKIAPGVLKKSIGYITNRKGKYPGIDVGPRTSKGRKKSKFDAWWAHFVEFGTAAFTVRKGKLKGKVFPGQAAQPFMRPAYDQHKDDIPRIMAEELRKGVDKIFKKTLKK